MSEHGSAGVVMLAVVAVAMCAGVVIADIGSLLATRLQAAVGADAAALAAAPASFPGMGSERPIEAARHMAAANGVRVVACRCPIDPSWAPRRVEVVVRRDVDLIVLGRVQVRAVGAADFDPRAVVTAQRSWFDE